MMAGSEIAYSIAIFACQQISVYKAEWNTDIPFESCAFRLNIYVVLFYFIHCFKLKLQLEL